MNELIKTNHTYILNKISFGNNNEIIKSIVRKLNKEKLITLSGIQNVGKINILKELLEKTGFNESFFYFNKDLDSDNKMKSGKDMINLFNNYLKYNKNLKIVILHNSNKIDGIKDFITKVYKENYKIILVGNTIHIPGKPEVEIFPNSYRNIENKNFQTILKYGTLNEVLFLNNDAFKERYLNLAKSDIFTKDIFGNFSVKSINLYNYTLSFLSKNNSFYSLRELHTTLSENNNISLKTTIDYVDFSVQSKIIKRVYKYDLKKEKEIQGKAKYYFTDLGIRNVLQNFQLSSSTLTENLVHNELLQNGYTLQSGLSGRFEFSFIASSGNQPTPLTPLSKGEGKTKFYIHISQETEKGELKKEINKMNKAGGKYKKYILVESYEKLNIKKKVNGDVEIVEVEEFLKKLTD